MELDTILASYINQTYLTDFLDDMISPKQLCAAPNRLIQNRTIMTRDLIQHLNKKHVRDCNVCVVPLCAICGAPVCVMSISKGSVPGRLQSI